jgi:uncharacterized circularly permuted ATP-grasp superfamily protein/uncharacterized alpha-E superfamily protein
MSSVGNPQTTVPWRLLEGYDPVPGVYDEMIAASDSPRPHCGPFVASLESIGRHELASRWENAKRALRENGVTYNVYGDPQGADRRWELDMMPLVIPAAEWSRLEAGLAQRTHLLNLILADIYGPQRLLHDRILPPEVVLGNPAFLRPCHGIAVPGAIHMHLHAVDLARSPDGRWWVIADRTQAPSGAGYTLENRIVLSQSLPETFRDCRVQRLAAFFRKFREALAALAPAAHSHPNVVLLTPGPYNETYYEHAYLARYLGLTLVEGADLTVRDCRVFIKTLDGLEEVDVIFRRLDDGFCDPLELRGDSSLGVPGLVEAARTGNVAVANALGSGVIETAAIQPFLPGLCRLLLGEELMLPSVATWWCGQPRELTYVLDHLNDIVVKRVFSSRDREPIFGRSLSDRERATLAAEIRARPEEFVGQEQVPLSTAPVWLGNKLEPRPLVLRCYVAATDSFNVMPGGLTRVAGARGGSVVSIQHGGGSKDTWVLSAGPVSHMTLLAATTGVVRNERRAADLPSRVADNLFWLGRQAERAEHMLRVLRSTIVRLPHQDSADEGSEVAALLKLLVSLGLLPPRLKPPVALRDLEQEMFSFLFKRNARSDPRRTLGEVRRLASSVRDRLSVDTSRILNQLHQDFPLRHGRIQFVDVLAHLNRMIADFAAFSGMEMENMTRGHGWRFLDVGRRLERAISSARLLAKALVIGASEDVMLEPLLEIADSSMTYRRRYFARPSLPLVLDLLLADPTNARAVAFQIDALAAHVQLLPRDPKAPTPTQEEQLIDRLAVALRDADLDRLSQRGEDHSLSALAALLSSMQDGLQALSDVITRFYFTHGEQRVS